jgi:hypothetical protein
MNSQHSFIHYTPGANREKQASAAPFTDMAAIINLVIVSTLSIGLGPVTAARQ